MNRIKWSVDGSLLLVSPASGAFANPISSTDKIRMDSNAAPIETTYWYVLAGTDRLILMLPQPVELSAISMAATATATVTVEVSTDSTDGTDGAWANAGTFSTKSGSLVQFNTSSTARAIRLYANTGMGIYTFAVFGRHTQQLAEIWNAEGAARKYLSDVTAYDSTSTHIVEQFRIKNTSQVARSFRVKADKFKYAADNLLSKFSFRRYSALTSSSTYTVSNLGSGELSEVIQFELEIPSHTNPKDGKHDFVIMIEEVL